METLYRKYRPQNFDEVIGQSHIIQILKSQLNSKNLSHSYIFIGPRGTGKTSVGRILAKAINCSDLKEGNPCGKCENCTMFQEGRSLDVVEIDAASNRSIDDIKNLKEKISFSPIKYDKKIYIIDEVHMLSKDAFNALLKTLEEPPSYVVFILATTEVQKVPLTILSRCQRFDFKLASNEELVQVLGGITKSEKKKVSKEALSLVAEMGKGSFRDSQTILQKLLTHSEDESEIDLDKAYQILGLSSYQNVKNLFNFLYKSDFEGAKEILYRALSSGNSPTELCVQLIRYGKKALSVNSYEKNEVFMILELLFGLERQLKLTDYDDIAFELYLYKISTRGNVTVVKQMQSTEPTNKAPQEESRKEEKIVESKEKSEKIEVKDEKIQVEEVNVVVLNPEEDLIMIKKIWPDFISRVKVKNIPLAGLLSNAEILNIEDNVLYLRMKYKFHKSRIENKKALEIILSELESLTKRKMSILVNVIGDAEKLDLKGENDIVKDVFSDLLK
ncbi:MAG: DNA polymerase III subunit gamma/tau [bacterium]